MSGFFSDLTSGIQTPNVIMNSGPLPGDGSSLSGQFAAVPDARINYNSTLLGDIDAYAYGKPDRLTTQTSYLNIPHRIQKIVPQLKLPDARGGADTFDLSHAVDDGDIVFNLRLKSPESMIHGYNMFSKMGYSNGLEALVNLPTVNYLLAGIQYYSLEERVDNSAWNHFMMNMDVRCLFPEHSALENNHALTKEDILYIVRECIRPIGVAHGSDDQGGQHQGSIAPATWPVDFVTVVTMDGLTTDLINFWRTYDISAGQDLILRLQWAPVQNYVLNHYKRGTTQQKFPEDFWCWQLKPDIYDTHCKPCLSRGDTIIPENPAFSTEMISFDTNDKRIYHKIDYRVDGYWHFAMSQVMVPRYGANNTRVSVPGVPSYDTYVANDDTEFTRGSLLQCTIQPMWICDKTNPKKISNACRGLCVGKVTNRGYYNPSEHNPKPLKEVYQQNNLPRDKSYRHKNNYMNETKVLYMDEGKIGAKRNLFNNAGYVPKGLFSRNSLQSSLQHSYQSSSQNQGPPLKKQALLNAAAKLLTAVSTTPPSKQQDVPPPRKDIAALNPVGAAKLDAAKPNDAKLDAAAKSDNPKLETKTTQKTPEQPKLEKKNEQQKPELDKKADSKSATKTLTKMDKIAETPEDSTSKAAPKSRRNGSSSKTSGTLLGSKNEDVDMEFLG